MSDFWVVNEGIGGVSPGIPGALPGKHAKHHITGGTDVIPNATEVSSGLMSSDDKKNINVIVSQIHFHDNKELLDIITQVLINEINDAISKKHEHANKAILDAFNHVVDDTKTDNTALWTAKKIIEYMGISGHGDMMKAIYDNDNDGIVDRAETADKLTTARNISLTGDVNGSASFDGSSNVSITTSIDMKLRFYMEV